MKIPSVEQVVDEIIEMRCEKFTPSYKIVKFLKKKYKIEVSRAYKLIGIAREKIAEAYKLEESRLEDAVVKLESLQADAIKRGDRRLALDIQKELNKLLELSKEIHEINVMVEQPLFSKPNNN